MLKKFVGIANVGRFLNYGASGNVQLAKLTLIFGENGKGKTTLTSIIRSLQTGDGKHINGRTRLPLNGTPKVKVHHAGGMAEFTAGAWNAPVADIEVFDAQFIDENVCSGLSIAHEHKRNLYRIIVGEQGVILSRKVDEIDGQIRGVNSELNDKKSSIKSHIADGLDVNKFVALAKSHAIDELIAKKEDEITALKSAVEIASKGSFTKIHLPATPSTAILAKTLEDLSKEAADAVTAHVRALPMRGAENWLQIGFLDLKETCPFCTQSVEGIPLVASYQAYFSKAYNGLKEEIRQHLKGVGDNFGSEAVIAVQNTFNGNATLTEFWKRFFEVKLGKLELAELIQKFKNLNSRLSDCMNAKANSPLEVVEAGVELKAALAAYSELSAKVMEYNIACQAMNLEVMDIKAKAKGGSLASTQKELAHLKNTKKRHEADVAMLCVEYLALQARKLKLEADKTTVKDALDTHSATIFGLYETSMNDHLTMFGAGFRLKDTSANYQGGKPNSTYSLSINDCSVAVDGEDGQHSFKTTLSGGDKSCLALAFFLARLDHDPRLGDKAIVLDDPMCSMDRDRSDRTVKVILDLARKAKQVVVLSHDPNFLRRLGDVPEHWEVKPLRRFNCRVQTGPFGSQLHADEYIFGGTPVINPTHMVDGRIIPSTEVTVSSDILERLAHQRLEPGDVIFSRRGELGRCALVTEAEAGWLCGTGSMILRLHQAEYDGGYLSLYLSMDVLRQFFESFSIGSVMNSLSSETLLSMPLIVPPTEEQRRIVRFATKQAGMIDTLQTEAEHAITLLQERRTALISAAVTGKIDVRSLNQSGAL